MEEPESNIQQIIHLYTGVMMTDLTVEQSKIPASKQIKHLPVTDWISTTLLHEAPHLHRRQLTQHAHHNHHLVSDFCLL